MVYWKIYWNVQYGGWSWVEKDSNRGEGWGDICGADKSHSRFQSRKVCSWNSGLLLKMLKCLALCFLVASPQCLACIKVCSVWFTKATPISLGFKCNWGNQILFWWMTCIRRPIWVCHSISKFNQNITLVGAWLRFKGHTGSPSPNLIIWCQMSWLHKSPPSAKCPPFPHLQNENDPTFQFRHQRDFRSRS